MHHQNRKEGSVLYKSHHGREPHQLPRRCGHPNRQLVADKIVTDDISVYIEHVDPGVTCRRTGEVGQAVVGYRVVFILPEIISIAHFGAKPVQRLQTVGNVVIGTHATVVGAAGAVHFKDWCVRLGNGW